MDIAKTENANLTRREAVKITVALGASLALAGCSKASAPSTPAAKRKTEDTEKASFFNADELAQIAEIAGSAFGPTGFATLPGLEDRYYYGRTPGEFLIAAFRNVTEPGDGYVRSFGMQGGAWRTGWERAAMRAGIGKEVKHSLRTPGEWRIYVAAIGEMLPRWENRMTLHPTRKDRWDMPLVHLDVGFSDNEHRMAAQAKQDVRRMLEVAGCVDIEMTDHGIPGTDINGRIRFSVFEAGCISSRD